jgi:ribosomal protein S18 acetylase RimI-like enzyme
MPIRPIRPEEVNAARLLLAGHGWTRKVEDAEKFESLVQRSQVALVAVENDQVVGFIRAITDGIYNGYISMVVVAKDFQGRGIGSALVREAMGTNNEITWVLRADREDVPSFYEKLGFQASKAAMERRRQ